MIEIEDWEDYEHTYWKLERRIFQKSFGSTLSTQARAVYTQYVLDRIANYNPR